MTSSTSQQFNTRHATVDDAVIIRQLVHELAVFEKEPDAVKITIPQLKSDFGTYYKAYIVETNQGDKVVPAAFALYFTSYDVKNGKYLYLEDLYVCPQYRGKGVGISLIQRLAKDAVDTGCSRLEWQVLDWNAKAIAFYEKKLGAAHAKQVNTYRFVEADLKRLCNT